MGFYTTPFDTKDGEQWREQWQGIDSYEKNIRDGLYRFLYKWNSCSNRPSK